MILMYYLGTDGERIYTLKKVAPDGSPTVSAHPARFSPEDPYSRQRIAIKRRFNLLPTYHEQSGNFVLPVGPEGLKEAGAS